MINIYSRSLKNKILHILYKKSDFSNRQDIVEPDEFIQVASLKLSKNQTFKAHKHLWKISNKDKIIAQESWVVIKGKIKVEDDVWVCADAFIGPNIKIGRGAIIGARSVVLKDVSPNNIVGGNPAKFIKYRDEN